MAPLDCRERSSQTQGTPEIKDSATPHRNYVFPTHTYLCLSLIYQLGTIRDYNNQRYNKMVITIYHNKSCVKVISLLSENILLYCTHPLTSGQPFALSRWQAQVASMTTLVPWGPPEVK